MKFFPLCTFLFLLFMVCPKAEANDPVQIARSVARECLSNQWNTTSCRQIIGAVNKQLAMNYMSLLDQNGHKSAAAIIKTECAAASVIGDEQTTPEGISSAMTACANAISDVAGQTSLPPDQSLFEILYSSLLCYRNSVDQCSIVEKAYARYQ